MHSLMAKWLLCALLPGTSNLQLFVRFKILQIQPAEAERWPASPNWLMLTKFRATRGLRVWERILKA